MARLSHPALFYRDLEEYLTEVGGFVADGLATGEPVMVAVPGERLGMLRDRLPGPVHWVDMAEAGRNPGRILTELTDFADQSGDGRTRIVGEPIWAARTPAELREATRHEALINLALATNAVTVLCPYDVSSLSVEALADAERTHPVLWEKGQERQSIAYTDPLVLSAEFDAPELAEPAETIELTMDGLATVRHRVEACAAGRLSADRAFDLVLAVDEAASNAIRHGGGTGLLRLWTRPGAVVAEVSDHGRLADPLVGRRRPPAAARGGRGVWLIHQLCDLVEFRPGAIRLTITGRS